MGRLYEMAKSAEITQKNNEKYKALGRFLKVEDFSTTVEAKPKERTANDVRTELAEAERLRDAASKRRSNYSGRGSALMYADGAVAAAMNRQASEAANAEFEKYDARVYALKSELYELENTANRKLLDKDGGASALYDTAQAAGADMEKWAASLLTSPDAGYMEYLAKEYGTDNVLKQFGEIRKRKQSASKELEALGYDYDRMADYEKRTEQRERRAAEQAENKAFAQKHPVLASAATVPVGVFQGIDYLKMTGREIANDLRGENDWRPSYTDDMYLTNFVSDIRGSVSEELEANTDWELLSENVASFLYNTGMSIADCIATISTAGTNAVVLIGGAAAAQTAKTVVESGGTGKQAVVLGLASGAAEMVFEKFSIDNLLKHKDITSAKRLITETLKQGGIEASEEVATEASNILMNTIVMGSQSDFNRTVAFYMSEEGGGMNADEAKQRALKDCMNQVIMAGIGGFISGGVMGGVSGGIQLGVYSHNTAAEHGSDAKSIVAEVLTLDPKNEYAKQMEQKLKNGKKLTGLQIRHLMKDRDRLLSEWGGVEETSEAESPSETMEQLQTEQEEDAGLTVEKYARIVQEAETEQEAFSAAPEKGAARQQETAERAEEIPSVDRNSFGETSDEMNAVQRTPARKLPAKVDSEQTEQTAVPADAMEDDGAEEPVTLEEASKKYGAQAGAMVHTYVQGQDVGQYDAAYQIAYDMGKSGVNLSYAMKSPSTAYLNESQRELAYEAGTAAAKTAADSRQTEIIGAANGKSGRRKGTVRGDGVKIADMKKAFNDPQNKAYKILTGIAEATGIDIVLYRSQANDKGVFEGSQGKFSRNDNAIYIDINAGLTYAKDVNELQKYTMLRTFSHEFTHFIENWNPVRYNEFRKVVFDTLTERGEDVHDLIELKMEQTGLDYDAASREVVAEAMTDILPDASFVEQLAHKHRSIFDKLLERLKEFARALRDYFDSLGHNPSREANALKNQVGDGLRYVESIVKLFDNVAVEAVESYQAANAVEEVVVSKNENTTAETAEPKITTSDNGYTITDNTEFNSIEIKFNEKPSAAVRDVLKNNKFKWNGKKGVWYGKTTHEVIQKELDAVYAGTEEVSDTAPLETTQQATSREMSDFEKKFWSASQEERDEVVDAINANTNISHIAPTEIRESSPVEATTVADETTTVKEERENGKQEEPAAETEHRSDGQGTARLLEEVETGTVQGTGAERGIVDDSAERGVQTGRDDHRPDAAGAERGHGEGNRQSGNLRGSDGVSEEETSAREYTSKKGYRIELNKLASQKGMVQVDIYDKDNLPMMKPVIINEPSDWNKVKETIDQREAADKKKAAQLHSIVVDLTEQQSTELPKGKNFVIGDSLDLPKGEKARYKANVDAIRLVKKLEAEGRNATPAEQEVLSKYVGWGGLANAFDQRKRDWSTEYAELKELLTDEEYKLARGSTLNAHYTEISVIKAMYDGLKQLGFKGGRMLEPSSGVGNFVGAMPADMASQVTSWTMVELDSITGKIAKYLYPNADVRIQGFEKANIPNNFMDVVISNVPFGNYGIADKTYPKKVTSAIHNYFFAKSLDKVRPGGIVMFITSSYTMNSSDTTVRKYIMDRADLLGAIRLPNTAFKGNAGTEVVTDILVLKKRAAGTEYAGEDFLEAPYTNPVKNSWQGAYINSYFTNHPEMVLGTPSFDGGMYRGDNLTYKPLEGRGELADQIREAFTHIQGKMEYTAKQTPEKINFAVERATKKTKNKGLVVKDGKVYENDNGTLVEKPVAAKVVERISGMLAIRDAHRELQNALLQGQNENAIKKARKELNTVYDNFVKKHGYINAPANRSALADDPDKFSLFALENYDPDTKKATKADIFTKNTIAPNRTETHADDVPSGLIISMNRKGGVDVSFIAKLTGKTEEEVSRELIDSRLAYKNTNGALEAAEVYLSGNVRAKLRDAEAMVPFDSDYQKNVDALKAIIPADIPHHDIHVTPGTPWIPSSVYSDFAAYMLGTSNSEWRQAVDVSHNKETGNFTIELKEYRLKGNFNNTQKWGTNRRSFLELLDAMMNSRSVVVKDKVDDTYVINRDATAAANEKIEEITKEFQDWLWRDEARRAELSTLYNEVFNSLVTPKYNGDNLTVDGANPDKPLRPHQRDAVQRIISSGGNTLLAHKVGAGKTYEMAAAAMKLKQLGIVNKPMFAVPKSLVAQWGKEFLDFFPTAKLLVAEPTDFTAANRKTFANRIANGDYDAVIVSYEQFEKLPMSDDFALALYQEQIDSIVAAVEEAKAEKGDKSLSVKDLEKKRKSLQAKIDKLTDTKKDEDNIEFEQLGVDALFIDEAHNFKNLMYTTAMNNVAGLGNKDGSKRAFDLYTKVRYLQKLNGGRGIVFATATPVMNSMSEMYIMQRYLQPDLLEQQGLHTFDAWAKQFGEVVNGVEIKPSGQGYRVKQSFSRFKNMNELQMMFRSFADVLTDVPGLKIPKMKGGKVNVVVCEPGEFQKDYMKQLEARAEQVKGVDPSIDNMLKITSDGRKVAYTQRMIEPTLPYEEGCKIYRCADNVASVYQESKANKGTQLIFCDMATPKGKAKTAADTAAEENGMDMESAKLYDDIRARLVKSGIPKKEIAFIHEADTDAKKKKLFADVNEGKVRVLIGSTGKMGVGMNAQRRIVAIHHLDAPWRPGDVEQRNGRAYRQGNINEEVECFTYVTEGSFDARLWDILDRKQGFINQIMNGENVGREVEDTGEVTLSAAEVKALASGSPLILEQVQLDTEIKKLESLQRAHHTSVANARTKQAADIAKIAQLEKSVAAGKADVAAIVDTYSEDKFSITIGKKKYTDKKDAGVALMAAATKAAKEDGYTVIGSFAGFDLRVMKTMDGIQGQLAGKQGYGFKTYPGNTTYMINALIAQVEGLSTAVDGWARDLADTKADLAEQEKLIAAPFAKQGELDAKRRRHKEIMDILTPKEEQSVDSIDEDRVQYQARDYLDDENKIKKRRKTAAYSETETLFLVWKNGSAPVGEVKRFVRFGKRRYYEKTENGCVEISQAQYNEKRNSYDIDRRAQNRVSRTADSDGDRKRIETGSVKQHRDSGGSLAVYGQTFREKLRNDIRGSGSGIDGNDSGDGLLNPEQYQQRTNTLSDREVLAIAASEIPVDSLNDGEKDALRIFKTRLDKLEALQIQREEAGRLYKEQQFGKGTVDRAAAAVTLERMRSLDKQILEAEKAVLTVEDKAVLKRVLQKARKVVEKQQRAQDKEVLDRWRQRRNEAAAIKKYRDRIRKDVDNLSKWILHPNNKNVMQHVPDALKSSVVPFLTSIDFSSKRKLSGGEATQADKKFVKQLNAVKNAVRTNIEVEGLYSGYNDLPPNFMDRLQTFIDSAQALVDNGCGELLINRMTAAELKELSELVRLLKRYIMDFNRFHANAMYSHVYEAAEDTIGELARMKDAGPYTGGVSNFLFWKQIRPAYAFERFGKGGKAIYDSLRRGQATLAFNTKAIIDYAEQTYTADEVRKWSKEIKTVELDDGSEVKMPVTMMMSFYCLWKRPQGRQHILGQGIRVATYMDGARKISDNGHLITAADVQAIIGKLTPRQKDVADKLQKFMAEQGGKWGNHVTVARFGEELFGEEHYFPINSDGRFLQAEADKQPGEASLYALLNMGFTKQTMDNAKNRVMLYNIFDVFSIHMSSVAQYNAFALPVLDALKWFNYRQRDRQTKEEVNSVRAQMARVYGAPVEKEGSGRRGYAEAFVINVIKAFNGTEAQGSPNDGLHLQMLHRYNMAQVAFNSRVILQQPLAITRAALLISPVSIARGLKLSPAAIEKNIDEMRAHSGIAAWKALGFYDVNISRGVTALIKHDESFMDKVSDIGMKGAELADTVTWAAMWAACKEEVIHNRGLTPKREGFYEAVTELFEDVVYKTQVVDSVLTKNEYMRDKGIGARVMSSFMSEPTTTASMLLDAYDKFCGDMRRGMSRQQAWKKNGGRIARTIAVYAIGGVLLAAVQAAADAWRDDDEYQEPGEKWLEAFTGLSGDETGIWAHFMAALTGNVGSELNPLSKLPIVSELVEFGLGLLSAGFDLDIYTQLSELPMASIAADLYKGFEILHDKIIKAETDYTWYGGLYKILRGLSGLFGLPMAAATREVVDIWNHTIGAMAPSLKVKTYEPGGAAQIRYAYEDGWLTAEEAAAELLDKGFADTEDEAYWKMQGWEAGDDFSKYDALDNAVRSMSGITEEMRELTEHGVKEKDAVSHIKSSVGEWYREGEVSKQQAMSMLQRYCDMSSDEALATVQYWSFKKSNSDTDVDEAWLKRYYEDIESTGIAVETYVDYRSRVRSITGEGMKQRRMAVIDSLPITDAQKDALYYAEGWAASTIDDAPWH